MMDIPQAFLESDSCAVQPLSYFFFYYTIALAKGKPLLIKGKMDITLKARQPLFFTEMKANSSFSSWGRYREEESVRTYFRL